MKILVKQCDNLGIWRIQGVTGRGNAFDGRLLIDANQGEIDWLDGTTPEEIEPGIGEEWDDFLVAFEETP